MKPDSRGTPRNTRGSAGFITKAREMAVERGSGGFPGQIMLIDPGQIGWINVTGQDNKGQKESL